MRTPRTTAFEALGLMAVRRSRTVFTAAMGLVVVAVLWGTSVFGSLATGGAADPRSQSARADALTAEQCGPTAPDLVVLYTSTTRTVDPGFRSWWARDHAEHGV